MQLIRIPNADLFAFSENILGHELIRFSAVCTFCVRAFANERIAALDAKISELEEARTALRGLAQECDTNTGVRH